MLIMSKGAVRLRLSEVLEELGWTQRKFSEMTGLSRNAISNLAGDPRQIRLDSLAAIIEATGKDISELLIYQPQGGSESN